MEFLKQICRAKSSSRDTHSYGFSIVCLQVIRTFEHCGNRFPPKKAKMVVGVYGGSEKELIY